MENGQAQRGRSTIFPFLALLKKNIVDAFGAITKQDTFRVKLENDKVFYSYFAQVVGKLDALAQKLDELPKIEMKDSPASINIQTMGKETIAKLVSELAGLRELTRQNKPLIQKVQQIQGDVTVKNQQTYPFERILLGLKSIEEKIGGIRLEIPQNKQAEVKIPEFPTSMSLNESKDIIQALKDLQKAIGELPKSFPEFKFPSRMPVEVVAAPPQKYPMPVTNININPLRGFVKSTAVTVTTSLTPLPGTVLAYRRSVMIYNNDASAALYIGGSDVTTANGLIVPAGTYSPTMDAGPKLIVYGIAASPINARVFEMSNENIGG